MIKWFSLFFVLLIIATGCQTYRGDGAAAGAGTYPLKTSPAGEDTVLITVVDSSKAGGFDIRRTPMANIPVSTPVQTALNLKQDASTAVTADDVQDAIDEAIAGVDGSTITADTTDPTKAAVAVAADSATYATTAGTAGTVAAVSGDAVTSGTIADTRIASTIARDSEVAAAIAAIDLPAGSTITPDTTDNTKAASAVVADSAYSLSPSKASGVPSVSLYHEANGTDTDGFGFIGPASSTKKILYRISDESPIVGQVLKIESIATGQTITVGSGTMVADIVNLILSDETGWSGVPNGTSTDDILSWDGDSWEPIALTAHPAFASLLTAFNNAGLNSFTFTPSVTYPIWAATSPVSVSFDVTDTSTTYAVADVDYQYDGAGGFVENMTNTTGDTWTASVAIATDGEHTIQLEAVDDKSTPNTGQSAVYTINFDGTDPVVGTVTPDPSTHDGTGTAIELTIASITEANPASQQYRIYNVTDDAVTEAYQSFTGLTINETLPADEDTYRFDVLVTDLAGNTGMASSSNIVYEAVGGGTEYTVYITENTMTFNSIVYSGITAFTGVTDTSLKQVNPTVNYASDGVMEITTYDTGNYCNALVRFPGLSNIPATATITSVTFGLYVVNGGGGAGVDVGLKRLLRDSTIAQSTWNVYSTGNSWATGGGVGSGDVYATASASLLDLGLAAQWHEVTQTSGGLVADIQDIVDGTASNYGWNIIPSSSTALNYAVAVSSNGDNGTRPYLKVVYED